MNKFTIIAICLLTAVASSFTTFADRNDVRIVCDDLDVNGMLTAYRPHTFQLNQPIPDAENAFWVFNIPCVDEIFNSHEADKDQSLWIPKLSEMLYSDPIVTEQGIVTGTLTYSYEVDGQHYETAPLDLEFDLRPKIYKAEIMGVEFDEYFTNYRVNYKADYVGNTYVTVSIDGEYGTSIMYDKVYQTDLAQGVSKWVCIEGYSWFTIEVANKYGKDSVKFEIEPYGENWQLISDGEGNETDRPGPIKIIDPHFVTQNYNWEKDDMFFDNLFGVKLESENAVRYKVEVNYKGPMPFFSLQEYLDEENSTNYVRYYEILTPVESGDYFEFQAGWGDALRFISYNQAGNSSGFSEYIFSTDYITDPEILARINELKNQALGVEDVLREPDPAADLVHRFGDSLRVSAEVSELAVFNDKGEKLMHLTDQQGEVNISYLEAGVYFAAAKTSTGLSKTLKFRK